jgi:uncharacterized membrane protein
MKMKIWITLILAFALVSTAAVALPVTIEEVEIDGSEVFSDAFNALDVERGQEVEVRVEFTALEDLDNVEMLVFLSGYEYNDRDGETISKVVGPLDLKADKRYTRTVNLKFPFDLDTDAYKLRLIMADRNGDELVERYNLEIDTPRHALNIEDVLFVPGTTVRAGEGLIAKVRVENRGQRVEEDVRVTIKIDELGLVQQGFINEIEDKDDQEESEDLLLRIPTCTEAGTYEATVTLDYNRKRDSLDYKQDITVLASDLCDRDDTPKTQITLGTDFQTIKQGESGIYSITVLNTGKKSTSYTLAVNAPQGLSYKVSPTSAAVLGAGQQQAFYVFVEADADATLGPTVVQATLHSGDQMLQQLSLTANVEEGKGSVDVKRALEVGLVVLVVLLVVIGLIVGLSKLRGKEEDGKTSYY